MVGGHLIVTGVLYFFHLVCTVHQVASVLYTLTMKTLPGVLGI